MLVKLLIAGATVAATAIIAARAAKRAKQRIEILAVCTPDVDLDFAEEFVAEVKENPVARVAIKAVSAASDLVKEMFEMRTKASLAVLALAVFKFPFITPVIIKTAGGILLLDFLLDRAGDIASEVMNPPEPRGILI